MAPPASSSPSSFSSASLSWPWGGALLRLPPPPRAPAASTENASTDLFAFGRFALIFVFMAMRMGVKKNDSIEHQVDQESAGGNGSDRGQIVESRAQAYRFRQEIEESHADDRPGTEAEDEVQFVLEFERQKAATERRNGKPQLL